MFLNMSVLLNSPFFYNCLKLVVDNQLVMSVQPAFSHFLKYAQILFMVPLLRNELVSVPIGGELCCGSKRKENLKLMTTRCGKRSSRAPFHHQVYRDMVKPAVGVE